jgi:hypothetical protein
VERVICRTSSQKGDKTGCSYYRGISLLSASYKILSNVLLSRLIPYAHEIIGYGQCGFGRNRSTTYQIFYIRQILEKKWEYSGTVHQLIIDLIKPMFQLEGKHYTTFSLILAYPVK